MKTKRDQIMADLTKARKHFIKLKSVDEFDKRFKQWRDAVDACRVGMTSLDKNGWTSLPDDLAVVLLDAVLKAVTDLQSQEAERLANSSNLKVGTWE